MLGCTSQAKGEKMHTVVYRSIVDWDWMTNIEPSVDHRTISPSVELSLIRHRITSEMKRHTFAQFRTCRPFSSHEVPHA